MVGAEEVISLVAPLQDTARRCGLVGLTDSRGLVEALSPYSQDQIRHAVRLTARLVEAGSVRSPLGWLVNKARQGDPDYFPAKIPTSTSRAAPASAGTEDPAWEAAEARVSELELSPHDPNSRAALARLDAVVAERASVAGGLSERLTSRVDAHTSRVLAWCELATRAGSDDPAAVLFQRQGEG